MTVEVRQPSNPVMHGLEGRSLQVAEQPVWLPAAACCGYLGEVFPAFDLWVKWGSLPASLNEVPSAPIGPDPSWAFLFKNQRVVRQPIKQVFWDSPAFINTECTYTNVACYWQGPNNFGPAIAYPNVRWYLFYTGQNLFGSPPETQQQVDQAWIQSTPLSNTDSQISPSDDSMGDPNGDGLSTGPDIQGWILAAVKKQIYAAPDDAGGPLLPWFHPYAMYSLHPLNNQYPDSEPFDSSVPVSFGPPMFQTGRNTWVPTYNPINWPPHIIQTIPRGP